MTDHVKKINIATQRLEKIVVNAGIGKLATQPNFNDKVLPEVASDFSLITGQKPSFRPVKKSISGFKIREGIIVGLKSTLRAKHMSDFLERINKIVLPRIRDFRGISEDNIDQSGNLSFGIKENAAFPEINQDVAKINFGVEITLVPKTAIKNKAGAVDFYKELGVPFSKKENYVKKVKRAS